MQHKRVLKVAVFIVGLFFQSPLFSQGFIFPHHHPDFRPILPELTSHEVKVDIRDQVANVEVRQVFYNNSNRQIEGTYYFPLPKGASVSDFKMYVDGKVLSGELLDKDKARKIYEDIVRRNIDPALLEYIDHDLFSANIFPIPPQKERTIVLQYSSLLEQDGDLVKFTYPLRGELRSNRFSPTPQPHPLRDDISEKNVNSEHKKAPKTSQLITINVQSKIPIKNIYSPSHDVDISKKSDHLAKISYEGKRKKVEESFVLYYSFSQSDFGLNLLTYRPEQKENGFFMLLISPKVDFLRKEIIKKDIIFVLDTSGSMKGDKITQAKAALQYCINHLNDNDRFNVISFSSETKSYKDRLVSADEYKQDALNYIDRIDAKGGTNINEALLTALKLGSKGSKRPLSIVFLTDGLPTEGEREANTILNNISAENKNNIKIFAFGVGYDVNTFLLDKIAANSRAVSDYIEPDEKIDEKITAFYDKISYPVLTNLNIHWGNIQVEDVFPKKLPDLFKGSQLTVLGRYVNDRMVTISLTGEVMGQTKRFDYEADFSTSDEENTFLPHLWATRKIGYLMEEIRLHGENAELKDEIIRLSKKHGVMSPYTSFLVQEDDDLAERNTSHPMMPDMRMMSVEAISGAKGRGNAPYLSAPKKMTQVYEVKMSQQVRSMKEANTISDNIYIKHVGERSFYRKDDFWIDTEYNGEETFDIRYGSPAYIELILAHPEIAKIMTLGEKVIFKFKKTFIKIGDQGKKKLSNAERKRFSR